MVEADSRMRGLIEVYVEVEFDSVVGSLFAWVEIR